MAGQTTINPETTKPAPDRRAPARRLSEGASHLLHDLLVLVELQAKLFGCEARSGVRQLLRPAILAAVGGVLLLTTLPVLMLAAAATIVHFTTLPLFAAVWIGFGLVFVPAGILLAIGLTRLRAPKQYFERSRDELQNNLEWIKAALKRKDES